MHSITRADAYWLVRFSLLLIMNVNPQIPSQKNIRIEQQLWILPNRIISLLKNYYVKINGGNTRKYMNDDGLMSPHIPPSSALKSTLLFFKTTYLIAWVIDQGLIY